MTDTLRSRMARAAIAIAKDFKTDDPESAGLILVDLNELLDAVVRIADEHRDPTAGVPLEELDLSLRIHNALLQRGIRTVEQLAASTPDELFAIRNLGQTSVTEIEQALAARGLVLGTTAAAAPAPDFFQAGHTYIQDWPDAQPEHCTVFRCIAVTDFPGGNERTAGLIAMGFSHRFGGDSWSVYLSRQHDWAEGWTEYPEAG